QGVRIGQGWQNFRQVIDGGDGILYAVTQTGDLLYYRDLARNGTSSWANGGQGGLRLTQCNRSRF
ncbi:MAG: tachylectin-related carbohydrate-binding protein, partial [Solirubrobacteraceae bacterium]